MAMAPPHLNLFDQLPSVASPPSPTATTPRRGKTPRSPLHSARQRTTTTTTTSGGGDPFEHIDPAAGTLPLGEWTRRVTCAREAGQQMCVLYRIERDVDYEWNGARHVLVPGHPFDPGNEPAPLRAWMTQSRVSSVRVHIPVPDHQPGPKPTFGYLVAEWFTPHGRDRERLERDHGYTAAQMSQRIPQFAAKRDRARAAGQLECVLLPVTGGYDYTGSQERGYTLNMARFRPIVQWASAIDAHLFVRVPTLYDQASVDSFDPRVPCPFGHLVCSWEVPPSLLAQTKHRQEEC